MAKISKRISGKAQGIKSLTITVESAGIEDGKHVAYGKTSTGKDIIVEMFPRDVPDKDNEGKIIKDGFAKLRKQDYQFVNEAGEVEENGGKIKLGKGGILEIMRGQWGPKRDGKIVAYVPAEDKEKDIKGGHYKVHFYNEQDVERMGHKADLISASTKSALMFQKGSLMEPADLSVAFKEKMQAHLDGVQNLAPVVAVLETNAEGQVIGDERIVYASTWNKDEARNATLEEALESFKTNMAKELEGLDSFQMVLGEQLRFNTGLNKYSAAEIATNKNYKIMDEGEELQAYQTFARPGLVKIKFSEVENDETGEKARFNSINTITYSGGEKIVMEDGKGRPETLVEGLSRVNGLEVEPGFKVELDNAITSFQKQDREINNAEWEAKQKGEAKAPESANTDALEAELGEDSPSMER